MKTNPPLETFEPPLEKTIKSSRLSEKMKIIIRNQRIVFRLIFVKITTVFHIHFIQCILLINLRSVVYRMIFLEMTNHLLMTVVSKSNPNYYCSLLS